MSIRNIVRIGNPILTKEANWIKEFNNKWLTDLIQDLYDTMEFYSGIGLSAPQINIDARVVVIGPNNKRPDMPKLTIINPTYEAVDDTLVGNWESCFSIPGIKGYVKRFNSIKYSGVTYDNKGIIGIAEGWQSIILQHEIDHLDGVTLLNRVSDYTKIGFSDEVDKFLRGDPK